MVISALFRGSLRCGYDSCKVGMVRGGMVALELISLTIGRPVVVLRGEIHLRLKGLRRARR